MFCILNTKTANQTRHLINRALQEHPNSGVFVGSSSGPSLLHHQPYHKPISPSERSLNSMEYERLPPLSSNSNALFRHYVPNGQAATYGFQLASDKSPTTSPKKQYIPKTMNTKTTIKMPSNSEPVMLNNSVSSRPKKKTFHDSNRKSRKLWWSPQRNHIEIRSEDNHFNYDVSSKIGSLDNVDYRPGGGHISIRDEPPQWHASSKVGSLTNANWSSIPSQVAVRSEKVHWDAQAKVNSMANLDYQPLGGNVAIRDDRMDLSHITPRVDCGFIE